MPKSITEMMERIKSGEKNPNKYLNVGGQPIKWTNKEFIQDVVTSLVEVNKALEETNESLIMKNNELLSEQVVLKSKVAI